MKKIILTLAFALTAAITAQAQPVYSNVVGMNKTTLSDGGFQMVNLPLSGDDPASGVKFSDAFSNLSDGSVAYIWVNNAYLEYTYYTATGSWYNKQFDVVDNEVIPKGSAVWLKDGGGGSEPVHSGPVPSGDSYDVDFGVGFNMIGNPYPVNMKVSDISSPALSDGDVIYYWDGTEYQQYTYYTATGSWYNKQFDVVDNTVIPVGKGVWLSASASGTITFTKPY
jgi:hypothetical protein